ncbi:MAG: thioredoxin [Anaerolineae bacterium]|nr:thioredoxin [Anaerolineae bacterium]
MSKPIEVTDATFEAEVLKADLPVLVDFWAAWCGPCKMIAPIVEELAKDYAGKIKVCKLNVDENNQTAAQFGIMSIPTLMLFKGGKPVERLIGYMPKAKLVEKLSPHLAG